MMHFLDLPPNGGDDDGHQGTEEVEEAVGKIGDGGGVLTGSAGLR
jgi:hypothetical protein